MSATSVFLGLVDGQFMDAANLDFRLKPGNHMHGMLGFPGIAASLIGIQR